MVKDDYTFTKVVDEAGDDSAFKFKALRVSSLEIMVVDIHGEALDDVFITVSSGKTILKGQTSEEGTLKFSSIAP